MPRFPAQLDEIMSNQTWNNFRVGTRVLLREELITVLLFVAAGVIPIAMVCLVFGIPPQSPVLFSSGWWDSVLCFLLSLAMLVLLGTAIAYRAVALGRESVKRDSEVDHKC
jgi:hypothetical protein